MHVPALPPDGAFGNSSSNLRPAQIHERYRTRDVIVVTPGSSAVAIEVKGRSAPRGSILPEPAARGSHADTSGMGTTLAGFTERVPIRARLRCRR